MRVFRSSKIPPQARVLSHPSYETAALCLPTVPLQTCVMVFRHAPCTTVARVAYLILKEKDKRLRLCGDVLKLLLYGREGRSV